MKIPSSILDKVRLGAVVVAIAASGACKVHERAKPDAVESRGVVEEKQPRAATHPEPESPPVAEAPAKAGVMDPARLDVPAATTALVKHVEARPAKPVVAPKPAPYPAPAFTHDPCMACGMG